jgi:ubiquinone/menaquinone biosynthesis C-methylase UbiE
MNLNMNMQTNRQFDHGVLAVPSAEEESRQLFVKSLKYHLATRVAPGNRLAYERRALPEFRRAHGVPPKDHHEIRSLMSGEGYFQMWSALQRTSQEMMWRSVQISVERQNDELRAKVAGGLGRGVSAKRGSLTLDPALVQPKYHTAVDIHCMPGGYHGEYQPDDAANGAVYDRAVWIYAMGRMGPLNDDMGQSVCAYLKSQRPSVKPARILDMGCGVGHTTLPYSEHFPEAELHGIDVGAPMLRYAHARAEGLGRAVHFSQQNAEQTSFPDGYFDLIVSHILVHETSNKAILRIMKEAFRLLSPGGLMINLETPPYGSMPAFDAFMLDWDTRNNNEPFWGASHELDIRALAEYGGFGSERAFECVVPSAFEEADAQRTRVFQGGDFGGGGSWYLWGAQKAAL